jgi:hypothetical protein
MAALSRCTELIKYKLPLASASGSDKLNMSALAEPIWLKPLLLDVHPLAKAGGNS